MTDEVSERAREVARKILYRGEHQTLPYERDETNIATIIDAALVEEREAEREANAQRLDRIANSMVMPIVKIAVRDCAAAIRDRAALNAKKIAEQQPWKA